MDAVITQRPFQAQRATMRLFLATLRMEIKSESPRGDVAVAWLNSHP